MFLSEPRFEQLPCVLETGTDGGAPSAADVAHAFKLRKRGTASRARSSRPQEMSVCRSADPGAEGHRVCTSATGTWSRSAASTSRLVPGELVGLLGPNGAGKIDTRQDRVRAGAAERQAAPPCAASHREHGPHGLHRLPRGVVPVPRLVQRAGGARVASAARILRARRSESERSCSSSSASQTPHHARSTGCQRECSSGSESRRR